MPWNPLDWIDQELEELAARDLRRQLAERQSPVAARITLHERQLWNLSSNDYLGLAADARLRKAASEAISDYGWGSGASPLVSGRSSLHAKCERRLAAWEGCEAALMFSTGFAANAGTIPALVGPDDAVLSDAQNHASIIDGCRLSRAHIFVYPHNDSARLAELLQQCRTFRRRLIVTDSLFSMDGDIAPLADLAELAERHQAMLMVDEAHATGVFGATGRGLCEELGVEEAVALRVGTLSKALGGIGGFVTGPDCLIQWLANRNRAYVFSTAPPAAAAAAANAAVDIVRAEPERRRKLLARATRLREALSEQGWNVGNSTSQIIPLIVGSPAAAIDASRRLADLGWFVPAIRPPSVPQGSARLRISLTYLVDDQTVDALIRDLHSLASWLRQRPATQ